MDTAIVLYGPPASGKDTVTAALVDRDQRFRHYQRMKVGAGRTAGYRMISPAEFEQLTSAGEIIYSNSRYGSTYIIDRPELAKSLAARQVPVIHVGQLEAVDALLAAAPNTRWVVTELWCPREIAAERIDARNTGDTAERLEAWEATPRLATADVRIDTALIDPVAAAGQIIEAVDAARCTVVVPAMHLVQPDGTLDMVATQLYASAAATSWVDYFLINGSTASGNELPHSQRTSVLDAWLEAVGPNRLLACAWSTNDIAAAAERRVTPMAVLKAGSRPEAQRFLRTLPAGSMIYSHPEFGHRFDAELARWAKDSGCLPVAGKISKISLTEITEIQRVAPEFAIWDGSSRRIRKSISAGAGGIVAMPLAARLTDLPPRSLSLIQPIVDALRKELDQLPDRAAKRRWLLDQIQKPWAGP
ncbi:MAG: hypothetical protein J2P18_07555 [Nocardia sp.]|nr:hypothetical protein [Nocardia sp.]